MYADFFVFVMCKKGTHEFVEQVDDHAIKSYKLFRNEVKYLMKH
jgi:hypothetical protein